MYAGSLDGEELIDWINTMDKYFEYENLADDKKVKFEITQLRGHASIWWDEVQDEKRQKGKSKIKSWDRMVEKLKGNFCYNLRYQ